jgi:cytochrome c oxidase subunit 2
VNRPIKLIMTSEDVIHSFFIPDFRVKSDVVPGMYTSIWFEARETGEHVVFCAEYCGTAHSKMLATLKVLSLEEWDKWKGGAAKGPRPASMVEYGKQLYQEKGCFACHSTDGAKGIGPSYKGIWNEQVALEDGKSVLVDENYVRESIEFPDAKIVKGYANTAKMPSFKGLVNEEEMTALIAFIKSLKH